MKNHEGMWGGIAVIVVAIAFVGVLLYSLKSTNTTPVKKKPAMSCSGGALIAVGKASDYSELPDKTTCMFTFVQEGGEDSQLMATGSSCATLKEVLASPYNNHVRVVCHDKDEVIVYRVLDFELKKQ